MVVVQLYAHMIRYVDLSRACILIESIDAFQPKSLLFGHEKPTYQLKSHHLSLNTMSLNYGPAVSEASWNFKKLAINY